MKKVSQSIDDMLSDYLDGNLNNMERAKIEETLQQNTEWKSRLDELRAVGSMLTETKFELPSKNFTQTVMLRLDQYPEQSGFSIRNGILLLTGVLLVIGIATVLVASGVFDNTNTRIDLNQVKLSEKLVNTPLPSFELNGKLLVNIIIVLNLGLAWIVLDRGILRPLFQKRMHMGR